MDGRDHVFIERLKAYLLDQVPLEEDEHHHLMRCSHCVNAMAWAALESLQNEKSDDAANSDKK